MALIKQTKGKGSHTLVTFSIENNRNSSSSQVTLLGDFNNWQSNDSTYKMDREGDFHVKSIQLENGKCYEFRYLNESNEWFNDNSADNYVPSPYEGIQNSVVDLSTIPKKKRPTKKVKKNDLKKIEGIGPKIAAILTEKGIDTFEKLSKTSIPVLENILKDAGSRFSMHKPNSWPKQAKLAKDDKWDELKKSQNKLNGGK